MRCDVCVCMYGCVLWLWIMIYFFVILIPGKYILCMRCCSTFRYGSDCVSFKNTFLHFNFEVVFLWKLFRDFFVFFCFYNLKATTQHTFDNNMIGWGATIRFQNLQYMSAHCLLNVVVIFFSFFFRSVRFFFFFCFNSMTTWGILFLFFFFASCL